jgi:hypothetical protein
MQNLVQKNVLGYRNDFLKHKFGPKKRNFGSTEMGATPARALEGEDDRFRLSRMDNGRLEQRKNR